MGFFSIQIHWEVISNLSFLGSSRNSKEKESPDEDCNILKRRKRKLKRDQNFLSCTVGELRSVQREKETRLPGFGRSIDHSSTTARRRASRRGVHALCQGLLAGGNGLHLLPSLLPALLSSQSGRLLEVGPWLCPRLCWRLLWLLRLLRRLLLLLFSSILLRLMELGSLGELLLLAKMLLVSQGQGLQVLLFLETEKTDTQELDMASAKELEVKLGER